MCWVHYNCTQADRKKPDKQLHKENALIAYIHAFVCYNPGYDILPILTSKLNIVCF